MNHDIPLKYFDIADEYATECAEPVAEAERTPLAHYFQLLLTRLMNNEEISEEAQHEMAAEAGINPVVLIHLKYEKNREDIGLFGIWRD